MISKKTVYQIPVVHLFMMIFFLLFPFADQLVGGFQFSVYVLCICILLSSVWALFSWRLLTSRFIDPYTLFLISAYIFNAGHAYLEIFALNKYGILFGQFRSETIQQTLYLVLLGMSFMHFGAIITAVKYRKRLGKKTTIMYEMRDVKAVRQVGVFLTLISFPFVAYFSYRSTLLVLSEGYSGYYRQEFSRGILAMPVVLSIFMIPGIMFLLASSRNNRIYRRILILLTLGYVSIRLFFGDRGGGLMILIAFGWVWNRCIKEIDSKKALIVLGILIFIISPVVGFMRHEPGKERLSFDSMRNAYLSFENPAVESISEMGASMGTISYVLELVPSRYPHDWGGSYFYGLLMAIPNFMKGFDYGGDYGNPAEWLVKTVKPAMARKQGGLGFSFIGEAYLNFGWLGAPIALFLIGIIMARFEVWEFETTSVARIAVIGTILAFLLHASRGMIVELVRPILWYSLLPYLVVKINKKIMPAKSFLSKTMEDNFN